MSVFRLGKSSDLNIARCLQHAKENYVESAGTSVGAN
jgi:hypothetical protein